MQVFKVLETQETEELKKATVGDCLTETDVLILADHKDRLLYCYMPQKSAVVAQFIGRSLCKEYRRELKGFYRVKDFGDLSPEQQQQLKERKCKDGRLQEIKRIVESFPGLQQVKGESGMTYEPRPWTQVIPSVPDSVFSNQKVADILEKVKNKSAPPGYRRQSVIIKNIFYNYKKEMQMTVKGPQETFVFEQVGHLPEGYFFSRDCTPRVNVVGEQIESIELFVREGTPKKEGRILAPIFFEDKFLKENDFSEIVEKIKLTYPRYLEKIDGERIK